MNAAGLHGVLTSYAAYCMRSRTHLALTKDTPIVRPVQPPSAGRIVAIPQVGGLHSRLGLEAPPGFEPGMEVLQTGTGLSIVMPGFVCWSLMMLGFPWCLGVVAPKLLRGPRCLL